MLLLHRLESRRQRKPLGKISFLSLFFITALDSLKPEGGGCFQPWTVLNNEPPVVLSVPPITGKSEPLNFLLDSGAGIDLGRCRGARRRIEKGTKSTSCPNRRSADRWNSAGMSTCVSRSWRAI